MRMEIRWLVILFLALLMTLGLAAATAICVQLFMSVTMIDWFDDRWLRIASLVSIMFPPTVLAVQAYRRRRTARSGRHGSPERGSTARDCCVRTFLR
jgi:hypothetical protein